MTSKTKTKKLIIATIATIALLGLSSVFITYQEALAQSRERPEVPTRGWDAASTSQQPTTQQPASLDCVLNRNILLDPLRANIVPTEKGFQSIIMEKEIFDCVFTDDPAPPTPVIFQDALVITYHDNENGKKLGKMKIKLISCNKFIEFAEFGSSCANLGTPPTTINPLDCSGDVGTTEAFVDMDSTSFNWFQRFAVDQVTTKTIIVEKEILDCVIVGTTIPVIAEVFTIEEKINGKVKKFKWVVCEKDPSLGILACIASDTPPPA